MSHLGDKLKAAALGTQVVAAAVEQRADALLNLQAKVSADASTAFQAHEDLLNDAETGLEEVQAAAKQLSNS